MRNENYSKHHTNQFKSYHFSRRNILIRAQHSHHLRVISGPPLLETTHFATLRIKKIMVAFQTFTAAAHRSRSTPSMHFAPTASRSCQYIVVPADRLRPDRPCPLAHICMVKFTRVGRYSNGISRVLQIFAVLVTAVPCHAIN